MSRRGGGGASARPGQTRRDRPRGRAAPGCPRRTGRRRSRGRCRRPPPTTRPGRRRGSSRSRVELLAPLAADLRRFRLASGRPDDRQLVFPRVRVGGVWNENAYRSWRRKVFSEAVASAKLPATRPYDLRHSFASLLIAEGRSVLDVADQLGHAPTMTLDVYGHVFADLEARERRSAEDPIREARENVREKFARAFGD